MLHAILSDIHGGPESRLSYLPNYQLVVLHTIPDPQWDLLFFVNYLVSLSFGIFTRDVYYVT